VLLRWLLTCLTLLCICRGELVIVNQILRLGSGCYLQAFSSSGLLNILEPEPILGIYYVLGGNNMLSEMESITHTLRREDIIQGQINSEASIGYDF
jgi:hypothetical protein